MGRKSRVHDEDIRGRAETLATNLRSARGAASRSQEWLARESGVALNTVRNIERVRTLEPSVFTVASIADALSLDVGTLLASNAVTDAPV